MEPKAREVVVYQSPQGKEPFSEWRSVLDKSIQARIDVRIDRIAEGHFGENRHLGSNLYEAKYNFGSGYRVYFGIEDDQIIILLTGGAKSKQQKDIEKANEYWEEHLNRGKQK